MFDSLNQIKLGHCSPDPHVGDPFSPPPPQFLSSTRLRRPHTPAPRRWRPPACRQSNPSPTIFVHVAPHGTSLPPPRPSFSSPQSSPPSPYKGLRSSPLSHFPRMPILSQKARTTPHLTPIDLLSEPAVGPPFPPVRF
jgi:hypothetical protein